MIEIQPIIINEKDVEYYEWWKGFDDMMDFVLLSFGIPKELTDSKDSTYASIYDYSRWEKEKLERLARIKQ